MTSTDLSKAILSILGGNGSKSKKKDGGKKSCTMDVKELRRLVLLSQQIEDTNAKDDSDVKDAKKQFKKNIQLLENDGYVTLSEDGIVTLLSKHEDDAKKRNKKHKKDTIITEQEEDGNKSSKKKRKISDSDQNQDDENADETVSTSLSSTKNQTKKSVCKGNPLGITRLFLGNLPFSVDESYLNDFLSPAIVTHIKWITDKETGKFYGSAFVEMRNVEDAAIAVTEKNGLDLIGRPIRINYAPAREGDIWPPKTKVETGGGEGSHTKKNGGQAGGVGLKGMSTKPENCVKLFIGNLSYDIDDEGITKFFATVDAELKAVRWLHHKDSGDFKGCGYAEFWNSQACEKAATLNGKNLLGRPIRIDWAE